MELSRREELLLRRIDADLERDDPVLARRLAAFVLEDAAGAGDGAGDAVPAPSCRPAGAALVVLSVALAVAVFLLALVMLSVSPPCERPAPVRSSVQPAARSSAPPPVSAHAPASGAPAGSC